VRTTINLDDGLLADARLLAQQTRRTLTAVIEDALRERLARPQATDVLAPTQLTTVAGNGLQPGVHLGDSGGLRELMDAPA
jgi:putative antitoxin of VapBC-like toxin-antitoxin system